jgi:hypothetical protein
MVTQQTLHHPPTILTIPTILTVPATHLMAVPITMQLHSSMGVLGVTTPQLVDQQMVNREIMKIMLWNRIILLQEIIIKEMAIRILRLETVLHIGNNMAAMVTINMLVMLVEMGMQISIMVEMEVVLMVVQIMVKQGRVHITLGITLTTINKDSMGIMGAGNKVVCIME